MLTPDTSKTPMLTAEKPNRQTIATPDQTTADQARRSGGAPPGNVNALKHGGRSQRARLWRPDSIKRPDLQPIKSDVGRMHSQLSQAAAECKGEISIADASAIDCACGWEFHAQLCLKHLAAGNLKPEQEIEFSRAAATARDNRHKMIVALDLKQKDGDPLAALYLPPPATQPAHVDDSGALAQAASNAVLERTDAIGEESSDFAQSSQTSNDESSAD